jgi:hypothetical protein
LRIERRDGGEHESSIEWRAFRGTGRPGGI